MKSQNPAKGGEPKLKDLLSAPQIQELAATLLEEDREKAVQTAKNIINAGQIQNVFVKADKDNLVFDALSIGRAKIFEDYLRGFEKGLANPQKGLSIPDKNFRLTFNLPGESLLKLEINSLVEIVEAKRRVLLRGKAGGGKSGLLRECANLLLKKDIFPLVLNFKNWKPEYSSLLETVSNKFDVLCRVSVTDLNPTILDLFPRQFIIADALNEAFGAPRIYEELGEYVRKNWHNGVCVLATDRTDRQIAGDPDWTVAKLNLLSAEDVKEQILTLFGSEEHERLPDSAKELLQIPFFLNIALESESPLLGSAAAAIKFYLERVVHLSIEDFDRLAETAFRIYEKDKSASFNTENFKSAVGEDLWNRLVESGQVIPGEFSKFDHQLKHDYLASRYLSKNELEWRYDSFDAVTFKLQSLDLLSMTIEQTPDENAGERFLKAVYDWNWKASLVCLQHADATGNRQFSREMEVALLALNAEKLNDTVVPSSKKAEDLFKKFTSEAARDFFNTDFSAVKQGVALFESDKEWFNRWKQLFMLEPPQQLTEFDIRDILSEDPVIGWTAANSIRRFVLDGEQQRQLRAYSASINLFAGLNIPVNLRKNHRIGTVLWRIVHALGKTDNEETINLLFDIFDDDNGYHWARYGAARSIVEIAAVTKNPDLRASITDNLTVRLTFIDRDIREEICNTAIYDKNSVAGKWAAEFKPVIEKSVALLDGGHESSSDYSRVKKIFDNFESYYS